MFIKKGDAYVKSAQGKVHSEKGEYGSGASKQTLGAKGNSVNWNAKWQGTKLEKSARG